MLRIDLAEVRAGVVETSGQIQPSDPLVTGAGIALAAPLQVSGRFSRAGEGKYFWHARMETTLRLECRRCLSAVDLPLSQKLELLFLAEQDGVDDDVGCYPIPARATELDLRDALREELLLALPRFVECRPDCRGLCPRCGANLNAGPCGCASATDQRWDALRTLTQAEQEKD